MPQLTGAASGLTPVGQILYNGVTFSPAAETLEFRATPVYDEAGRTVIYTTFSITIRDWLTGLPTDAQVQAAMSALLIPSAGFIYNGRGTGPININFAGVQDMVWGPKPRVITIKPLGASNAVEFTWQIEFATLNCGDARTAGGNAMEFNYRLTWDIDQSGYTKRTYAGFIRVSNNRFDVTDRVVREHADDFRDDINPPLLAGYQRTPGVFTLSYDKSRLDFSIIDEQFPPNVPPPGIIEAHLSHRYQTPAGQAVGTSMWVGSLDGTYEVARGVSVQAAWLAFGNAARDRITNTAAKILGSADAGPPKPVVVLPYQLTAEETDAYGKTMVRLGMNYHLITATLSQILGNGGMWRPLVDSDWKKWAASLPNSLRSRGLSNLMFAEGDDAIVDLCGPTSIETSAETDNTAELKNDRVPIPAELRSYFPPPTPANSYLRYSQNLRIEDDHGNVVVKLLPTSPLGDAKSAGWNASLSTFPTGNNQSPFPPADGIGNRLDTESVGAVVQQRVTPTLYVFLEGYALRAQYPVPTPQLLFINGKVPTLVTREGMGEGFTQSVVGSAAYPLYGAAWRLRYVLDDPPIGGPVGVPPNPLLGA